MTHNHNRLVKARFFNLFFLCICLVSNAQAFFVDSRPDPKIGDVNMSNEDRQELTNILGPLSPDTPVSEVQRRLIESRRGNTESVTHGTLPHSGNIMTYPEAQSYLKKTGEYLNQDNIVRVMQNGQLDRDAQIKLGAAGCPIGWRTTPMGECGFPLQPGPKASNNLEAWIVRDRMTAGTMFAFNVPGSYLDNPNNVPVDQLPRLAELELNEGEQKGDASSGLSDPDLLRLELLSSASALGGAAKASCKAQGEKNKSYEIIKMAANRFKESLAQRHSFVQSEMDKSKESVERRMQSDDEDVNYQLEALTLQMSSIESMIRSYVGEKHGSISIRNRFAKALEEAELFALEEFEEFNQEVTTCENQISNAREDAQEGCDRVAIVETCDDSGCINEEVPEPVEGSCEAADVITRLPEVLEDYQEHFMSVETSRSHKEKYEEVAQKFQDILTDIPSGYWSSSVNECGEKIEKLYKQTAILCESVSLSQNGEELKEDVLSELLTVEEMDRAVKTVLQDDIELFESVSSSEAELNYLQELSLEKFRSYDQLVAQPFNRVEQIEELRTQIDQLNVVDVMKAQRHFQEYQQVAALFQQSLKSMQNSNRAGKEKNTDEGLGRQLLDGQGVAASTLKAPTLSTQLLTDLKNAIRSQLEDNELKVQKISDNGVKDQEFLEGSPLNSSLDMGFSSFDGQKKTQGVVATDFSRSGLSSALSQSEQAKKSRLKSRTKSILERMGDAISKKREQDIEKVNKGLLARTKTIGAGNLPLSLSKGSSEEVPSSSFSSLEADRKNLGPKNSSLQNRSSRSNPRRLSKRNESSGSSEKSGSSISRSRQRSSLDSKKEVGQIYSRYKDSGESYSSVINGGQIHNKNSNIFDVISRRYLISGFKRLDEQK